MKTILTLATALLFFLPSTGRTAPKAKPQPESGQASDTVQVSRAALADLGERAQKIGLELDAAKEETHAAQNSEADALTALRDAQLKATTLQAQIDMQATQSAAFERDAASEKAKADKLTKEVFWYKLPLAICAGCIFLIIALQFNVPTLSPPYGLVATVAAPLIVFSAIMLL